MGKHSGHSLEEIIGHAAHLLPAQGPIGVFIHHNTLHAFQHLPFEKAVLEAADLYGTEPYMTEEAYRADFRRGRIQREDVEAVLESEPDAAIIPGLVERTALRRALLLNSESLDPTVAAWKLEENLLFADAEADLFAACLSRSERENGSSVRVSARPKDGLQAALGVDLDEIVHPLLIRLCGAFLDQGLAYWPMPHREKGFFAAACELLAQPGALYGEHFGSLAAECRRQRAARFDAAGSVEDTLSFLGVLTEEKEAFLQSEMLALPGWAGLFRRLEEAPELAPHIRVPSRLLDFLAVRLILVRVAAVNVSGGAVDLWRTPVLSDVNNDLAAALRLFEAARVLAIPAARIAALPLKDIRALNGELSRFDNVERRRLWHLAYERRHERQILLPLGSFRKTLAPAKQARPAAHVMFCIDEREESIRRQLEEIDPEVETLGAAGFFGVAIDYEGIDDAHSVSLCPVVVTPQHAVREGVVEGHADLHGRRKALRKLWSKVAREGFVASRSLVRGWLATATLGFFSIFPLIARTLTPRSYAKFRAKVNEVLVPRPETALAFTNSGGEKLEGLQHGFSILEKTDRVEGVLKGAGLVRNFARLVVVLGHGSTSLNNPHESAHDCGACGGRRGGPNARLFAAMANHPEVRQELARRGMPIPEDTWFVGGYHDTCSDDVELFDLNSAPQELAKDLERITASLDKARALSAHERARRFEFAKAGSTPGAALHHVEERSEHLAEPRPEYGHCTNAVAILGRRHITRGLFFDRRAFLISYDASVDPTDEYLARQMAAVVPVCGGISLEYYFSFVDNEGYGCGTKLPHNVTGLVGVMNGQSSDLRTGLPWQMVEIHEPVRILFVVETTPDRLLKVVKANATVKEFVENRWIRLSTIDPDSGEIHVYSNGVFTPLPVELQELPSARTSVEWYSGRMEHLPVARIGGSTK